MISVILSAALLAAAAVNAQTFTSCNPMNRTDCPLDTALGVANYSINFVNSVMTDRVWNTTAGTINYGNEGAEFTINQRGDSPTVQTNFYIFGGQVEVIMKAATGQGIISSIVLESDDLDEVDWEFMGGNNSYVETNYFGKGNTTLFNRAIYYPVSTPEDTFHNYTTDWSEDKIDWYIDGQIVRTLEAVDAYGGYNFPQTPMNIRIGIWAGGDSSEPKGTIEWAGGLTNYNAAPFTMTVQSVRVTDAHRNVTQYKYGNTSGSWGSIEMLDTAAAIKLDGNNSDSLSQTTRQKWNSLPSGTKIAIAASAAGVLLVSIVVFAFCCIKQRRAGKRERLMEDAKFEKSTAELLAYRAEMTRERTATLNSKQNMPYGNAGYAHSGYSMGGETMYSQGGHSNGGYAKAPSSYAQSAHTFNSGKGYQRY
jgi:beta-glucanase (GH16 family)